MYEVMTSYMYKQTQCSDKQVQYRENGLYLRVNLSEYIGQDLEELQCLQSVKTDEIVRLIERRLVQLLDDVL